MTTIDPGAQIGHVHLHVAELERAVRFYRDVLGFRLNGRLGDQSASSVPASTTTTSA
jgi:catechol 2,3-dioxygenase